jgi:hypothetical protein
MAIVHIRDDIGGIYIMLFLPNGLLVDPPYRTKLAFKKLSEQKWIALLC